YSAHTCALGSSLLLLAVIMSYSCLLCFFFFSSRRRHTRLVSDWSSDVCSSDLEVAVARGTGEAGASTAPASRTDSRSRQSLTKRSEERRVGKECRCWGGPDH